MIIFKKDVQRTGNLWSVKAWQEGESIELAKWIGFGFFNHLFVCEKGLVRLYFDIQEGDMFHEILEEKLNENLFDALCDSLFFQMEKFGKATSEEELYEIAVASWPSLSIFDEISKYPSLANQKMLQRLLRVRKTTETFIYDLEKKVNGREEINDFIYFKDKLHLTSLPDFINNHKEVLTMGYGN